MTERPIPSRRAILATGAAALAAPAFAATVDAKLKAVGAERQLPARMLGFNTPANNAIPFEDPLFAPAVKAVGPHYMRFPGGTVANYYNWRTGQLDVARGPESATVRNLFADVAANSRAKVHPKGVFWDEFHAFAERAGAEVIVLPNIETSSIENEAARFADMAAKGTAPRHLELGNEFTHALLMDPDTLKVFPDFATTTARMKAYRDAILPHLPKGALVAAQAASTALHHPVAHAGDDARVVRERDWDNRLKPEGWFDAVTVHLYPTLSGVVSLEAAQDVPGNLDRLFKAMVARADDGFERVLSDTAARVPGKQIWLTEWGGYDRNATFGGLKLTFNGLWWHQLTRAMLAQLRRPEVTVSNYHALFVRGDMGSAFKADGQGGYRPVNATSMLHWFFDAARGPDAHYRRIRVEGGRRIVADGNIPGEGFGDVEAALFRQGRKRTLIIHNAWRDARTLDLSDLVGGGPVSAETMGTPDLLASLQDAAPAASPLALAGRIATAPAYSLTRVTWSA